MDCTNLESFLTHCGGGKKFRADSLGGKENPYSCAILAGSKSMKERRENLAAFKNGAVRFLICTDVAARGIDIKGLPYIVNMTLPDIVENYIHRIGRVGRAGEQWVAISSCEPEENALIKDIEKTTRHKIQVAEGHPHPQTTKPMTAQEKKAFEKEKNRKKQEFFANRKKKRNAGGAWDNRNNRR